MKRKSEGNNSNGRNSFFNEQSSQVETITEMSAQQRRNMLHGLQMLESATAGSSGPEIELARRLINEINAVIEINEEGRSISPMDE